MNNPNPIDALLNKDLQEAIEVTATHVPDTAMADFEGSPILQWENPWNPRRVPNHRFSEFVSAPNALFKIIPPPHPYQATAVIPDIYHAPNSHLDCRPRKHLIEIIDDLLSPGFGRPFAGVNHGGMATLDMNFVMKCMGGSVQEHLEWSNEAQRVVLKRESSLLQRGREMGMPELYMQWLGGANAEITLRIPLATLRTAQLNREAAVDEPKEKPFGGRPTPWWRK